MMQKDISVNLYSFDKCCVIIELNRYSPTQYNITKWQAKQNICAAVLAIIMTSLSLSLGDSPLGLGKSLCHSLETSFN